MAHPHASVRSRRVRLRGPSGPGAPRPPSPVRVSTRASQSGGEAEGQKKTKKGSESLSPPHTHALPPKQFPACSSSAQLSRLHAAHTPHRTRATAPRAPRRAPLPLYDTLARARTHTRSRTIHACTTHREHSTAGAWPCVPSQGTFRPTACHSTTAALPPPPSCSAV
jgi:hypothetical protein